MAVSTILPLFPFRMCGTYVVKDVVNVVLLACCQGSSIEHAATFLRRAPSAQDIRHHLREKLDLNQIERTMNDLFAKFVRCLPKNRPLDFAIDYTLIPYYGQTMRKNGREVRTSKRKAGTRTFHAYATLYVIHHKLRFTIALKYVRPRDRTYHVVKEFIDVIKKHDLKVRRVMLDREFYNVRVIRLLKNGRIPAIIPVRRSNPGTGNTSLFKGKGSYATTYTLASSKRKRAWKVTFPVYVAIRYWKGQNRKHGAEHMAFVVLYDAATLKDVKVAYKKRFGIESSYRLMNVCRARTTSRNPAVRLLFVVISLLIQNIWVYTKWEYVHRPRQRSRKVLDHLLPLRLFIQLLEGYLSSMYGPMKGVWSIKPFRESWVLKRIPKSIGQRCSV